MKINILNRNVYSLIAAGEIVERPSSVIRELLDNSIDAGAANIIIEVINGGKKRISVIDDGEGIEKEDMELSVLPHSTSKIKNASDIESIETYGFRGEALHAISRISMISIESRSNDSENANKIYVKQGDIVENEVSVLHKGTIVEVNEIFHNIPARRKFLKSDNVELNHCIREFEHHALANPEISFKFINNGHVIVNLIKSELKDRISDIVGETFINNSFKINYFSRKTKVIGFIGKPEAFTDKKSRINHIFVNSRHVFNPLIRKALYSAMGTQLQHRHLPYVIMVEAPSKNLDVNIHPAKKEIKFKNENEIFPIIINSVKSGIQAENQYKEEIHKFENYSRITGNEGKSQRKLFSDFDYSIRSKTINSEMLNTYFYQYEKTYIITQLKGQLYMIDQHAAHERIMYEKYLYQKENISSQKLLFSYTVKLEPELFEIYEESKDKLEKNGFITRPFGRNIILVEGIPALVENKFNEADFINILEDLKNNENVLSIDEVIKIIACRSAVKAGTELSESEMAKIFSDLFNCENPFACPHGRPTIKAFTKSDIEKWFKRT